jgi:hypothetical protein
MRLAVFWSFRKFYMVSCLTVLRGRNLAKIRLYIKSYDRCRSRIESVPLKQLVKLSEFPKRRWEFKDGWLILEAF